SKFFPHPTPFLASQNGYFGVTDNSPHGLRQDLKKLLQRDFPFSTTMQRKLIFFLVYKSISEAKSSWRSPIVKARLQSSHKNVFHQD
ncbi:hypothetical protein C7Y66_00955, partial [Chroococcidiopsis sp. CCALA 051]|uniref:hypothetical protein n=1 Tax=Chroococcidiopsis sp. CCALA 051 TaxID=869949 RepID=UPI000D2920C9